MTVEQAYGRWAAEYIERLGGIESTAQVDRDLARAWADDLPDGLVVDVGCGPGQWTNWLHGQGLDVVGVEPTPEFLAHAQARYPDVEYRHGHAERLDVTGAAGILAWYSLIHLEPDRVPLVLAEFARCLRPGGGLLVGFFEGAELTPFDHTVATAYFWPVGRLRALIEDAGFTVTRCETRAPEGTRRHGAIAARLS